MLIPKKVGVSQIFDLTKSDQAKLFNEIDYCSKRMKRNFKCSNLNVEKVGNIIPQLHIHIIPRHKKDATWPLSVWVTKPKSYKKKELDKILDANHAKKIFADYYELEQVLGGEGASKKAAEYIVSSL